MAHFIFNLSCSSTIALSYAAIAVAASWTGLVAARARMSELRGGPRPPTSSALGVVLGIEYCTMSILVGCNEMWTDLAAAKAKKATDLFFGAVETTLRTLLVGGFVASIRACASAMRLQLGEETNGSEQNEQISGRSLT